MNHEKLIAKIVEDVPFVAGLAFERVAGRTILFETPDKKYKAYVVSLGRIVSVQIADLNPESDLLDPIDLTYLREDVV